MDVLPLHDQLGPVVQVADLGVVVLGGVEVGHERSDILSGGKPGVDVLSGVEEPTRGDGDVLHGVPVEGELEAEVDGGGSPIALGEHVVLLDVARLWTRGVEVVQVVEVVGSLLDFVGVIF